MQKQSGHLPTYVAIPLATGIFFFMAAFEPVVEIARNAPGLAGLLALAWLVLYVLIVYQGELEEFIPLAAAFMTLPAEPDSGQAS